MISFIEKLKYAIQYSRRNRFDEVVERRKKRWWVQGWGTGWGQHVKGYVSTYLFVKCYSIRQCWLRLEVGICNDKSQNYLKDHSFS